MRLQHAHRPRARSGRADRSCAACVAAGRAGGKPVDGELVSLGCEEVGDEVDRGVDRLARILVRRGASVVMCALGGWCACGAERGGAIVLISRGGWANRAGLGRRSHLELKRSLNLDLQGVDLLCVDLLFVERRRQRDDEW